MENLTLGPGATLIWRDIHRQDSDRPVAVNVAERAVEFLYEPAALDGRVQLGDVFKLLDACPPLRQVFRRDFAEELCAEARKGPLAAIRGSDPAEVAGIESLELHGSWRCDSANQTYSGVYRLDLQGVGHVLDADATDYGVKAGERINWSVSLTPLRELLDLPLRLREVFDITEDDIDACAYGRAAASARCDEVLLGQIIHSVLYELSFHGGPEQRAAFQAELMARKAEVDAGTAKLIPADDIFGKFDRPGFSTLFDTLGDVRQPDVSDALHRIPVDEAVGPWLDREFDRKVVVKAQYRDRPGREFRKMFRTAGR